MKKILLIFSLITLSLSLFACQDRSESPDIVASMYAHYDFAKQIVGDKMSVSLLIPLGADIHSFEASSKNIVDIHHAKLFLFTSLDIDTWVKDPKQIGGRDTIVLDMSQSYQLDGSNQLSANLSSHEEHDHDDLHYWVDPLIAIQMITYILEQIVAIDPEHEDFYLQNAFSYQQSILDIHNQIDLLLSEEPYKDRTIYFAGHNALGLFAERYHIHIESLFSEFKPDADLTSGEIIRFSNLVQASSTRYLFIESLIEPKAAIAIKENLETNTNYLLTLLELHTYHNLNLKDWEAKVTYRDLLQRNFEQIKIALGVAN